ncbi:MAG TPA: DinB family protein [Blastocatellia bacterium]|nr:DinB family protein [Blastocatellia bacterium]
MEVIENLEATKAETLKYFNLTDAELAKTYAAGKWTVRYLLHHLADSETVLFDRIRRAISDARPVVWAFDQDAWARGLNYSDVPLDLSKNVYMSVRECIIYYAQRHYERNGHLQFVHSETGLRTLKDEFDKVASHNEHHLEQIRRALG